MNTQINPPEDHPSLRDTYRMLAKAGLGFIRVVPDGKKPQGAWGDESGPAWLRSPDEAVTRLQSSLEGAKGNVGIVPRGDCIMIDFDGDDAIERFNQECEKAPEFKTFKVQTPNGLHVYCRVKQPELIPVTTSKSNWGAGVDIRSPLANSQVVGPGSRVESTNPAKNSGDYVVVCDAPIAYAPDHIELLCRKKTGTELKLRLRSNPVKQSPDESSSDNNTKPTLQACRNNITRLLRKIINAAIGERNNTISDCASGIGSYVAHWQAEFEKVAKSPLDRLLDAVHETFTEGDDEAERAKHLETAERQYQWGLEHPAVIEKTGRSTESKSPSMFLTVIEEMGFTGRFNLAWDRGEFWFPDEGVWRSLTEHEELYLLATLMEDYDWNIPTNLVKRYFAFAFAQNAINPDVELLSQYQILPDRPDLTLETSLSPWLSEATEYERWCQKAIWLQIVSKIMRDPNAIKTSVILRGDTNVGKSTLVKNLVPAELGGVGNLSLLGESRNILVLLNNHYAVEYDEGLGSNKKDAAFQKSIFGDTKKFIRKLHTSEVQQLDYRAAVIGTVNDEAMLYDDPALIRRFAFIDVNRNDDYDPKVYIPKYRKHLLALALKAYQEGERAYILPDHLVARQIEKAGPSIYRDISLDDQIASLRWTRIPTWFSIVEFAAYMGMAIDFKRFQARRFRGILERLLRSKGFVTEKDHRDKTWWRRPDDSADLFPYPIKDIGRGSKNKRERDQLAASEYEWINTHPFERASNSFDALH